VKHLHAFINRAKNMANHALSDRIRQTDETILRINGGPGTMRNMTLSALVAFFLLVPGVGLFAAGRPAGHPTADSVVAEPLPTSTFKQDRFAIGAFWAIFPDGADLEARFREIADAGFTLVFGPIEGCSSQRLVELCGKHGLAAIVFAHSGSPTELPAGDACWGYRLFDEPSTTIFPQLRERAAAIRNARPGKLDYINLYPNYASEKQLGVGELRPRRASAEGYDEYVARFVKKLDPPVLCFDHYPRFQPSPDGPTVHSKLHRDSYCQNLATIRKYALKRNIPFWNYFNTAPFGANTDPPEAQIRWQIYTSLAYGAKGILYFTYGTPNTFEFPKGGAILRRDGSRTRHWYQARRINAHIQSLGPTLMKLRSTGVYHVRPGDDPAEVLKGTPIRTIGRAEVDPPLDYLVGVFEHADGRHAVIINNYRFAYTAWATVEFNVPSDHVLEIDKHSGREILVYDDSPNMPGLQISLDAGEGRLFVLAKKQ